MARKKNILIEWFWRIQPLRFRWSIGRSGWRVPTHRLLVPMLLSLPLLAGCFSYEPFVPVEVSPDPASLYANNREEDRFVSPWRPFRRSLARLVRVGLTRNPFSREGEEPAPSVSNDGAYLGGVASAPTVTWAGHSTFAIHDGDDVFLTDPHFGARALIPGRHQPPGIPLEAVPPDAMAVLSHNHYDHLDAWTVEALPDTVRWFVPAGLGEFFRSRGRERVVELDWWQSVTEGRWTLTCLPSQHWSQRIGQPFNSTLWCSWLLDSGERRYYFAGDTGYFHGFREFGRKFPPIDVAMMPVGAYEPRWFMAYQHMNPEEAYRAFRELGARHMLAMHWGTFRLTHEALNEPPRALERAVATGGGDPSRVHVMAVGERWELPLSEPRAGQSSVGAGR